MKFNVGLPIDKKQGFIEKIVEHKDKISEVYFSWGSFAGGRSAQTHAEGLTPWEAEAQLIEEPDACYPVAILLLAIIVLYVVLAANKIPKEIMRILVLLSSSDNFS